MTFYFIKIKIVFLGVLRSEFGAVSSDKACANEFKVRSEFYRCTKNASNNFGIVFAKISNGIMIRNESFQKPHKFNIAIAFFLQSSGRTHAIELPVKKEFM